MNIYYILFYLRCDWQDLAPTYRLYFNNELMSERTYTWKNSSDILQERLPVHADIAKQHTITIEHIGQKDGRFTVQDVKSEPPGLRINVVFA